MSKVHLFTFLFFSFANDKPSVICILLSKFSNSASNFLGIFTSFTCADCKSTVYPFDSIYSAIWLVVVISPVFTEAEVSLSLNREFLIFTPAKPKTAKANSPAKILKVFFLLRIQLKKIYQNLVHKKGVFLKKSKAISEMNIRI